MNYEQKYKEALERAKYWEKQPTVWDSADICQKLFPELLESELESEDERIKRCIGMCLTDATEQRFEDFNTSLKDCIAWLEKQDTKLQEYINEERNKKDFYCEGKEMSWNEMPLDVRKHDYPYYFKGNLDCYPFNVERQGEQKPIEQDTEIRDFWEYIQEWRKKFGRLPKDADELAACIYYVIKRQKPIAWSEEDERMCESTIDVLVNNTMSGSEGDKVYSEEIDWLKSLKHQNRWKPSKEQLTALKNAIIGKRGPLYELYFELEKL